MCSFAYNNEIAWKKQTWAFCIMDRNSVDENKILNDQYRPMQKNI